MLDQVAILLAEDDRNDILLMQRAFEIAKIPNPLQVVHNGREAVSYLEGKLHYADRVKYPVPGLILLDLKMPWMDGFDVLRWMRARADYKALPVVMLTSSNLAADIERSRKFGAYDYRVKPSGFDELVELLNDVRSRWLVPAQPALTVVESQISLKPGVK